MIERSGGEGSEDEGTGPRVRLDLAGMTTLSEAGIDFERANAARIYDYFLGGAHNFASDRAQAAKIVAANPDMPRVCRVNRDFLGRVVRWCLAEGVDQFLDLGSGVPTVGNVHEIALARRPEARIAYVDFEPVAVQHAREITAGLDGVSVTQGDLRQPKKVLGAPGVADLLDFDRPVAILAVAVLHFIDDDLPAIFGRYRDALGAGSILALNHGSSDQDDPCSPRACGRSSAGTAGRDPGGPARPDADRALLDGLRARPARARRPRPLARAEPRCRTRRGVRGRRAGAGPGVKAFRRPVCVAHTADRARVVLQVDVRRAQAGPDRVLVPRERASRTPRREVRSARRVRPGHALQEQYRTCPSRVRAAHGDAGRVECSPSPVTRAPRLGR